MSRLIPERARTGDLWGLGAHRLLVGDCTNGEDVARLMDGTYAALVFTSPPYAHQRKYDGRPFDWTRMMSAMSERLPLAVGGQLLVNLGMVHGGGEWHPYWEEWLAIMRERGWLRFGLYVWHQGEGLPGDWSGRLAPCFEFLFHLRCRDEPARRPNKFIPCKRAGESGHGTNLKDAHGRAAPKVGQVASHKIPDAVVSIFREKRRGLPTAHPAVFPVALPAHVMRAYANEGEIVYDPFVGGGTSFLAGEETGRTVMGMEVHAPYADIALLRAEEAGIAVRLLHRTG